MKKTKHVCIQTAIAGIFIISMAFTAFAACTKKDGMSITIGSKNFTENIIIAHLFKQVIEAKTDLNVKISENLGNTFVVFEAIKAGDIDLYPDFTGTMYQANLKQTERRNPEEIFQYIQQEMKDVYNLEVFPSLGYENNYALGMKKEVKEKYNLQKISDLVQYPEIRYVFDHEFAGRKDGADELFKFYGIKPTKPYITVDIGLRYKTLMENEADITDAFTTDVQLKRFKIVTIEDDKQFFPSYELVPLVRRETIEKHPKIADALKSLKGSLREEDVIELSWGVEVDKKTPNTVVSEFLSTKQLP